MFARIQTTISKTPPTSPVSSGPKDHLSCLPPELIREIFSLAYPPGEAGPSFPLSRSLFPVFLETVYRHLKVESYASFSKLCRTMSERPELGELARRFTVAIALGQGGGRAWFGGRGSVANFVRAASSSSFSTPKSPLLSSGTSPSSISGAPSLTSRTLFIPLTTPPFHTTPIDDLHLNVSRQSESFTLTSKPLPRGCSPLIFPPLVFLCITGPFVKSPAAKALLSSFTSVFDLRLIDFSSTTSPLPLLSALSKPDSVDSFALVRAPEDRYDRAIETFLPTLQNLDILTLAATTHLKLASETPASTAELAKLVAGPRKHPALEKLTLDVVWGEQGTRIEEDKNMEFYPGVNPEDHDGMKKLVQLAEPNGVELAGDAVDALEVEKVFLNESDHVAGFELAAERLFAGLYDEEERGGESSCAYAENPLARRDTAELLVPCR
ncbi:hypothetical protein JCM8547_004854 [Rhodosporidiobolus lusitaniae]